MADKNPQKLAAARRMLKEYQKKSREGTSGQPSNSTEVTVLPSKGEDFKTNNSSTQNYVYDSGTTRATDNLLEIASVELKHSSVITSSSSLFNNNNNNNNDIHNGVSERASSVEKGILNGGNNHYNDKSNEHYISQLVSELNNQQVYTSATLDTTGSVNVHENNNNMKSAIDFFNSLPISSQSSVDFSFDTPSISDSTAVYTFNSDSNSTVTTSTTTEVSAAVPSFIDSANVAKTSLFNISSNTNDSQSDQSESVPLTPSEHDKSDDVSSSSVSQSPRHTSKVLELQLKEIDTKLGIEINKNSILTDQLQQANNHIRQLQECIETIRKEYDAKVVALEEKLHLHVKTLEIVVSEKTELQSTLTTCQESVSQKAGEIEELQCKLRASRHKVGDLERELNLAQALRQQQEKSAHEATLSKDMLKKEVDLMRKHLDESTEEVLDLKHKLQEKCVEITSLNDELKNKDSQLSVSQLRIDQLSASEDGVVSQGLSDDFVNSLQSDKRNLEQEVEQLNTNIKNLTREKDESCLQYQQYVNSLNTQLQTMATKYEALNSQCESLTAREASLVEHIASLEKQMQQSLPRKASPPPTTAALSSLQQQNAELIQFKQQFEEISAEKRQLEEQLSLKQNETEKLNVALEEYSLRVKDLERFIERLEADRPDANLLQAAIESDKVAASRAIAQNTDLKNQLQELQDAFIKLSNNKLELTEQLQVEENHCKELTRQLANMLQPKVERDEEKPETIEKIDFCSQTYTVKENETSDVIIDFEAMTKLEDKFNKKMQEVAELSDEKQRLEHLVLQLQGETETIGEYIALYQIQRGMLRQKSQEKDEQMARLSQEREVLRNKLNELNHLVTTLLPASHNHHGEITPVESEMHNEEVESSQEVSETTCIRSSIEESSNTFSMNKEETAGKIRALLTEIGSSKLVSSDCDTPNFHPCPLCSGRLITV